MGSKDLYRDTPVRYLGYANEVGEACRAFIGTKWVNVSYTIATLYSLADTVDKTITTYKNNKNSSNRTSKTLYTAFDVLTWQMLASVIIPGFIINRICAGSNYLLKNVQKLPPNNRQVIVTSLGLLAIPFIIKPIDNSVDHVMDATVRKWAP